MELHDFGDFGMWNSMFLGMFGVWISRILGCTHAAPLQEQLTLGAVDEPHHSKGIITIPFSKPGTSGFCGILGMFGMWNSMIWGCTHAASLQEQLALAQALGAVGELHQGLLGLQARARVRGLIELLAQVLQLGQALLPRETREKHGKNTEKWD